MKLIYQTVKNCVGLINQLDSSLITLVTESAGVWSTVEREARRYLQASRVSAAVNEAVSEFWVQSLTETFQLKFKMASLKRFPELV